MSRNRQTAAEWVRWYREQGVAGFDDRSSRRRLRQPTSPELAERVEVLRRERWTGFRSAQQMGLSRATVSRILRRAKLSQMRDLEPKPPVPPDSASRNTRRISSSLCPFLPIAGSPITFQTTIEGANPQLQNGLVFGFWVSCAGPR
jgi:hypothetical protein